MLWTDFHPLTRNSVEKIRTFTRWCAYWKRTETLMFHSSFADKAIPRPQNQLSSTTYPYHYCCKTVNWTRLSNTFCAENAVTMPTKIAAMTIALIRLWTNETISKRSNFIRGEANEVVAMVAVRTAVCPIPIWVKIVANRKWSFGHRFGRGAANENNGRRIPTAFMKYLDKFSVG